MLPRSASTLHIPSASLALAVAQTVPGVALTAAQTSTNHKTWWSHVMAQTGSDATDVMALEVKNCKHWQCPSDADSAGIQGMWVMQSWQFLLRFKRRYQTATEPRQKFKLYI